MSNRRALAAEKQQLIYGVHPVHELVEGRPASVERLFVARENVGRVGRILKAARLAGIPVSHLAREAFRRKLGRGASHQGIAALVAPRAYTPVAEIYELAIRDPAGLLLLLDGVQDAGNLGAILRTAAAAGVQGAVLASERTAGLSAGVARASAGAAERIPVGREPALPRRLRSLAEAGFTTCLLDPRAEIAWCDADLTGPLAVVVGGEAKGVRPGVAKVCNLRVAMPLEREVESLNVAIAVSVLLFEAVRQRRECP